MRPIFGMACGLLALLLSSCGGGGTADAPAQAPGVQANSIQRYAGDYSGGCELVDGATNVDQGGAVYARTVHTVSPLSDTVGAFSFRVDFYADAQCTALPLGSLSNSNPGSRVAIVGAIQLDSGDADKVKISILPPAQPSSPGGSPGTAVFGSALKLSLPSYFFEAVEVLDLWRLEGSRLLEGDLTVGLDGFPLALDAASTTFQVPSLPALPAQPCASRAISWVQGAAQCSAQVPLSLSTNLEVVIRDIESPTTGSASYTCVNGEWSTPSFAFCADSTPPQPDCAAQTWTWTVNGNTCMGTVPARFGPTNDSADNVIPGFRGTKLLTCVPASNGGYEWSEFIFAPSNPTITVETCDPVVVLPPVTDPIQILTNKNCMACHSVGIAEPGLLSFEAIAAFYRNSPPAPGVLETKIKQGGVGVFVDFPMPPNPQISDDELAIVVPWILSR